ncbi:MAG TPA: hypothetical protein VI322_03770, partial [Candidatus Saccharimonadia bacterium]
IQPYFFSGPKARSIPSWVDRVFSADVVEMLLNYWGNWQGADFCSMNCNGGGRFKVDNHPILAYDKNGDPTWRVLMTSQNSNTSANWVILFDARTGEIRQFTPLGSMPIEESLTGIFESAMGTNGVKIPFQPVGLTFHVIQGEPTWMMTYLATNGKSVAGYGFMQAYSSSPGDVAFGETKDAALDAYSTKLAAPSGSGTVQQGGKVANVSGVITDIQRWDESGQAFAHIKVDTKPGYIFKVQLNSKNAEVGFAHPMDTVVITYNDNGPDKKVVDVRSINVTPVKPAGSLTQALFTEHQTSAILEVGGAVLVVFVLAAAYAIWRRRRNSAVIGDSSDNGPDSPEDLVDAREHLEEITGVDINHDGVVGHNPDTVKENVTADEPANRIVHS